jgi:hypothetical protein
MLLVVVSTVTMMLGKFGIVMFAVMFFVAVVGFITSWA